jgi:hypothetical protein
VLAPDEPAFADMAGAEERFIAELEAGALELGLL